MKDLSLREMCVILPVVFFIIWLGVYPKTFLDKTEASVYRLVRHIEFGEPIRWTGPERSGEVKFVMETKKPDTR